MQPTPTPEASTRLMAWLLPSSSSMSSAPSRRPQPVLRGLARARAFLAQHPGRLGQLAHAGHPARQRVGGRGHDHHLVAEPAPHGEVGMRLPSLDEADVGVEADHRGDHVGGVADDQPRPRLRVVLLPAQHDAGQQVFAGGEAGRDAQRRLLVGEEHGLQLGRLVHQRDGAGQERAAVLVEHQAAADAVEQLRAERGFQVGQRGAGGRLRTRDAAGRGARGALARGGREHLQLAQREAQSLIGFIGHDDLNYLLFCSDPQPYHG